MSICIDNEDFGIFLKALRFAAEKHRDQRRKDSEKSPYINHPIGVAETLWKIGGVRDITTLVAALLHDTIEDTDTTEDEVREQFGDEVLQLVLECTDDKSLPKEVRKQKQIENAPHKSARARKIKLSDKINNIYDITHSPPSDWPLSRRQDYLAWSENVVNGLRGQNPELEQFYDQVLAAGKVLLEEERHAQK